MNDEKNKPKQTQPVVSLSNLFQTRRTLRKFFLFFTFLNPPDYEQTWFEPGGEVPSASNPPVGCAFGPRCPLAGDDCLKQMPELKESSVYEGHFVACWKS